MLYLSNPWGEKSEDFEEVFEEKESENDTEAVDDEKKEEGSLFLFISGITKSIDSKLIFIN